MKGYDIFINYIIQENMKVKLHTLGCKVNQYETEVITEDLIKNGFTITQSDDDADIFIVNSCTVTSESDRKTRQTVRRLKHKKENSVVILTGCMPQAFPDMAQNLIEADIVIGNKNNKDIVPRLKKYLSEHQRFVGIEQHKNGEKFYCSQITGFSERTRAIVKIEDGCDRFCSYCIIPKARGRVRSKPLNVIRSEVEKLSKAGFQEVVLVGINLSAYGKDTGDKFYDAVKIAASVDGIKRVRLGSLEPDHLTDEVIEKLSLIKNLCPQFHISLQSGSDSTLSLMNRHYTADEYYALCLKLRNIFKYCTITTDIMVGFPSESDGDFNDTVEFVKKVGFEKVHVFPYSVRSGTKAASMDQIDKHTKEKRAATLSIEAAKIRSSFLSKQIGKTVQIIAESKGGDDYIFGYTANYIPVMAKKKQYNIGDFAEVKIIGSDGEYCYAE